MARREPSVPVALLHGGKSAAREHSSQSRFGALLRHCRLRVGLSQEELAERAHISVEAVSALERGIRRSPRVQTLRLLAEALDLAEPDRSDFFMAARRETGQPEQAAPQALPIGGYLGALPSDPMVARQEELERVLRAVDAVAKGSGRLVMLVGEPGIGKTRLAQEVTLHLRDREFLIASGRCYEPREAVGFYPFLDVLSALYDACPAPLRADVPRRWPYLTRLLPEQHLSHPTSADGHGEQERLYRAVGSFVSVVAQEHPVAILLDDLHWADSASLDLLQHLARHLVRSRVLLLGTYRDVEVPRQHPLSMALRSLQREGLVERIAVRRLDEDETRALIARTIGAAEVSTEFTGLVHRSTEGNPFFTREVLRTLVERGDLYQQSGHWKRPEIERIVVPASVRDAIWERLSRLAMETQEVLREASVLGQRFGFEELAGMSEADECELETALEEAQAAGLVHDAGNDAYSFDHVLTQRALYDELSARRRRRLHLAAGRALEELPERKREGRAGELAWHFLEGAGTGYPTGAVAEQALRYSLQAADEAAAVFAHLEAERPHRTALKLARGLGDEQQEAHALERLGMSLRALGRYDEALEALERAATLRHNVGDDEAERHIVAQIGWLHTLRATPEAGIARVQSLLAGADEARPSSGLAALYTALAHLLYALRRYGEMLGAARRAAEVAAAVGDDRTRAVAEGRRGVALAQLVRYEEALPAFQAAADLAATVGDFDTACRALTNIGQVLWIHGDFAGMRAYHEQALEAAQRLGDPAQIAYMQAMLALAYFLLGDWEQARQISEQAVETIRPLGPIWQAMTPLISWGRIGVFQGNWEQAVPDLEEAIAIAERSNAYESLAAAHVALAQHDLLRGDAAAVISQIEPLLPLHSSHYAGDLLILKAEAHLQLGQSELVDELADEAVRGVGGPYARLRHMHAARVKAMARAMEGRWDEAERGFTEALDLARGMPFPYAEANTLRHWGRAQVDRGMTDAGRQRLEEACAIFQRLGAKPDLEQTEQALAATG